MVDALMGSGQPDRAEIRALLALDHTPGVGPAAVRALVETFGSAVRALSAPRSEFTRVVRRLTRRRPGLSHVRPDVDAALSEADRLGMAIRTWACDDYPRALLNLHDPPPVLFLRGRRSLLRARGVTIVGARRATSRSRDVAEQLAGALASAGPCVVSGLALGVDGAAHRGALAVGGDTIAVLGRGADAPYPGTHRRLFHDVLEQGLVVSEFLPGTPALPHHFPRRNRLLAALSEAVVVVEAGARSGALITVDHALDLGIDVWAVPGPIDLEACAGSNRLLSEGARPLTSIDGFVEEVTGRMRSTPRPRRRPGGAAGRVLAVLAEGALGIDEVAGRSGLRVSEALTVLTELELSGRVERITGMRFREVA